MGGSSGGGVFDIAGAPPLGVLIPGIGSGTDYDAIRVAAAALAVLGALTFLPVKGVR